MSAVRLPCQIALAIPANYDTHLPLALHHPAMELPLGM